MAVVHQLGLAAAEPLSDRDRANVVRLVEFLGPISPELVLVDPELARRARAFLPELPWNWQPGPRQEGEPIIFPVLQVSAASDATRSRWRLVAVAAVAGAAAAAFAFGVSVAGPARTQITGVESPPPVATPVAPPAKSEPTPAQSAPKPKPKPSPAKTSPVRASPRFVWPAVAGARAYRIALYRGGRQVFERDVTSAGFQLPLSWIYQGRPYGLERGPYRWVVWPLLGAARNQAPAIVSAQYAV